MKKIWGKNRWIITVEVETCEETAMPDKDFFYPEDAVDIGIKLKEAISENVPFIKKVRIKEIYDAEEEDGEEETEEEES